MTINQIFPFKDCESCPDCVLDVETKVIFGDEAVAVRELYVGCRNSGLCQRQRERAKQYKETSHMCTGFGYDSCETCEEPCPYR